MITFNASATPTAVQALVRNITYQNTDIDNPTTGARTVRFVVTDGDGGTSAAVNATVTVSAVNDAPTSTNDAVLTAEDTPLVLAVSDFGTYNDVEATPLAAVRISALATDGLLEYDTTGTGTWAAVTLNQVISAADITAGRLRFAPDANETGSPYATIGFEVSDGAAFSAATYTLTASVAAVNDAPSITSNGAGATASVNAAENQTAVTDVDAADPDVPTTITYSLAGGADQALFTIDATTGVLSFLAAPNFEAPADADTNGIYEVTVRAADGALFDDQAISVTVTNATTRRRRTTTAIRLPRIPR